MIESESRSGPEVSAAGAMAGIFREPLAIFRALAQRPTWWLPFVAGILISAVFSVFMTDKMDYEAAMRQAIEKRVARSGQPMPAERVEQSIDRAVEMQRKLAPFSPTIGAATYAFFFFVIALALAFSGSAFGAEAKIPVYLSIYAYAQIPMLLRSLLAIVRLVLAPESSLTFDDLGRLASASPVLVFSPRTTPGVLLAIASSLDVFVLATVAFLVIGFRALPGLSRRTATILPIALWSVLVLLRVGWAAIFG
jgi:hypothetical protein